MRSARARFSGFSRSTRIPWRWRSMRNGSKPNFKKPFKGELHEEIIRALGRSDVAGPRRSDDGATGGAGACCRARCDGREAGSGVLGEATRTGDDYADGRGDDRGEERRAGGEQGERGGDDQRSEGRWAHGGSSTAPDKRSAATAASDCRSATAGQGNERASATAAACGSSSRNSSPGGW